MIEILFIIDFLENVILQRPKGSKKQNKELMKKIKTMCVNKCKENNFRFIDYQDQKNSSFRIQATKTDDSVIIGAVVKENTISQKKVWFLIDKVSDLLKEIDIEDNLSLKEIKPLIEEEIEKANKSDTARKVLQECESQNKKVKDMIKQSTLDASELGAIDIKVTKIEQKASDMKNTVTTLKREAYWYDKKLQMFLIGMISILVIFVLIYIFKFI